ncbi:MAG: hypothetical protein JO332_15900 [Planctomycetaceae bacterium]|nr:hypothetical protein [Planctomycetaceae bacterium]
MRIENRERRPERPGETGGAGRATLLEARRLEDSSPGHDSKIRRGGAARGLVAGGGLEDSGR